MQRQVKLRGPLLDKNGELVSKGYHKKYGENHAERDALLKLHNTFDLILVLFFDILFIQFILV